MVSPEAMPKVSVRQRSVSQIIKSTTGKQGTQASPPPNTTAANSGNTNADTCVLGPNFIMEGYSYRSAEVYPYDKDSYDPVIVPIGAGVMAYDCPVLR